MGLTLVHRIVTSDSRCTHTPLAKPPEGETMAWPHYASARVVHRIVTSDSRCTHTHPLPSHQRAKQ